LSNKAEHVTRAVQYCIQTDDDLHRSVRRIELSSSDSLFMQNTLERQSSLHDKFSGYQPGASRALCDTLLNFGIRVAIRTPSGGVCISPANTGLTYEDGRLFYKRAGTTVSVKGVPLFIDVTARAFTETSEQISLSAQFDSRSNRADFLVSEARKNFRRIVVNSRYF
jgi:hypothetical protein